MFTSIDPNYFTFAWQREVKIFLSEVSECNFSKVVTKFVLIFWSANTTLQYKKISKKILDLSKDQYIIATSYPGFSFIGEEKPWSGLVLGGRLSILFPCFHSKMWTFNSKECDIPSKYFDYFSCFFSQSFTQNNYILWILKLLQLPLITLRASR